MPPPAATNTPPKQTQLLVQLNPDPNNTKQQTQ
jgi:hypothetical protein